MSKKSKESGDIGFSISGERISQTSPSQTMSDEMPIENPGAEPKSTTPQNGPQVPQVENPAKKKRGPYKKRNQETSPAKPQEVKVTLNRDAFVALSLIYNAVLAAAELPPPLSQGEKDALETTACAVAQKYASNFEHWELAAFAAALVTPALMRFMSKMRDEPKQVQEAPKTPEIVRDDPKSDQGRVVKSEFFANQSHTSEIVGGAS